MRAGQACRSWRAPARRLPVFDSEPDIQSLQASPDWLGIALFAVAPGADIASSTRSRETYNQAQSRVPLHHIACTYNALSGGNRARHAMTAEALARRAAQPRDYAPRRTSPLPGRLPAVLRTQCRWRAKG